MIGICKNIGPHSVAMFVLDDKEPIPYQDCEAVGAYNDILVVAQPDNGVRAISKELIAAVSGGKANSTVIEAKGVMWNVIFILTKGVSYYDTFRFVKDELEARD